MTDGNRKRETEINGEGMAQKCEKTEEKIIEEQLLKH
jgi:hypothetical protein